MNVNTVQTATGLAVKLSQQLTRISYEMAKEEALKRTTIGSRTSVIPAIMNLIKVIDLLKRIEQECGKKPTEKQ